MIDLSKYLKENLECSLFHYTGIGSLIGISKSNSLWASSVYYLNDGEEIIYAQKKLINEIENRINKSNEIHSGFLIELIGWLKAFQGGGFNLFIFSLSEERSILSQWRSYTPHGKGVSIEFNPNIVKKISEKNNLQVIRVRYNELEQQEIIKSLLDDILTEFDTERENIDISNRPKNQKYLMFLEKFRGIVLQTLSILKHPAFKEEKEWRLVSRYFPSYVAPEIKYREGASMLVPYIEIEIERYYDNPSHTHAVFFKSVCLGPSPNPGMSFNALSQFVSNQKITHHTSNSNIPYREWS